MLRTCVLSGLAVLSCSLVLSPDVIGQAVPANEALDGLTTTEWSSIKAAYDASRHAAHPVDGSYCTQNPGQQLQARFDGRGFTTEPDGGGWTWGLELLRYGFAGNEMAATAKPESVSAKGQRVSYHWSDKLTEWYVNDTHGLEHGYTVHEPPGQTQGADTDGPLTFILAIRGALRPVVTQDGRSALWVDDDEAPKLNYSGLTAFDSHGKPLPAQMQEVPEGLALRIDVRGAYYPLTIDPVVQQVYLKASNTDAFDNFGASMAVSGDTVVVGAPAEDSSATGVNGDASDNSEMGSGAAYVFIRGESGWSQQAYLKASNTDSDDGFGWSLSLSGETLVVGARHEDSAASGVGGDQRDNSSEDSGAAYVFVRNGSSWSQQAYLKASNAGFEDQFGFAVAVSDDTLVVGAQLERSAATGVNGDQDDDSLKNAGAVYVFVRNGTAWSQQAYVKASNTDPEDEFGRALDLSSDTLVVGSRYEDSSATGVNGDQGNQEFGSGAGAAYVFVRNGSSWSQQAYLKAFNTAKEDYFGDSVAVSGDTVVVGAFGGDGEFGYLSGTAYVFGRSGVTWAQEAYLTASNIEAGDKFGWSVAVSGDVVVVGALLEDSDATGVDGDGGNNLAIDSGAAYIFVRSGSNWNQQAYVKASNSEGGDQFGGVVAVSGTTVLVGSAHEDSRATGVNGDPVSNLAEDAGAAYSFDVSAITPDPWADMGCALPGTFGAPLLVGVGVLSPESSNSIDLSNTMSGALAALFLATSSTPTMWKGGTLKPFPFFTPVFLNTSTSGTISIPFVMPPGVPADTELWVQWGIQDSAAISGVALSNAIKGVTP